MEHIPAGYWLMDTTYTLKGSFGSEVRVILKVTFDTFVEDL